MEVNDFLNREHLFIRGKALGLVYSFHALRFPSLHIDLGVTDFGRPNNAELVDSGVKMFTKLSAMRHTFMPVARTLFKEAVPDDPANLHQTVSLYCQEQISAPDQAFLRDPTDSNRQLSAAEILPEDVLWSMYDHWSSSNSNYCKPLQRLIINSMNHLVVERLRDQSQTSYQSSVS